MATLFLISTAYRLGKKLSSFINRFGGVTASMWWLTFLLLGKAASLQASGRAAEFTGIDRKSLDLDASQVELILSSTFDLLSQQPYRTQKKTAGEMSAQRFTFLWDAFRRTMRNALHNAEEVCWCFCSRIGCRVRSKNCPPGFSRP